MVNFAVDVFFYGSYINFSVLREAGIGERPFEVVSALGFELVISPLANLKRKPHGLIFGIRTRLTHPELDALYTDHALGKLGGRYLPEAVLVRQQSGEVLPALCYIAHHMAPAKPDPAYVDRILHPAKAYRFPQWYVDQIRTRIGKT